MAHHFLRRFRYNNRRKHSINARRLRHEHLEPRAMLTINAVGDDFTVNDVLPGFQAVGANATSVAVSNTVGTLVAYSGSGTRDGVFLGRFDLDGTAREVLQVNTTTRGARGDASVVANDSGATAVVWQGQGGGDKYGIFLQRYDENGDAVGEETLVNTTTGGVQTEPAVAIDSEGNVVVAWSGTSAGDAAGVYARRFGADGSDSVGELRINTTTAGEQSSPSIAMSRNGEFVITWTSYDPETGDRNIFGQRFESTGARAAQGEFQLNAPNAAIQDEASVAMQDDGTFMAVWSSFGQDGDSWSVVGRVFSAEGEAVDDEFVVNTTTTNHQRSPQIAGARGKYLVTWQSGLEDGSGWEVMARDFDASGTPSTDAETLVNTGLSGTNSGHQESPAVALNAAGRATIVWSGAGVPDRQGVYARSFIDADGADENSAPELEISDQTISVEDELLFTVTATDADSFDTLSFELDASVSPSGATITPNADDPRTATIRWTPDETVSPSDIVPFRVIVADSGIGQLERAVDFDVEVTDGLLRLDINGQNEIGTDATVALDLDFGSAQIVDERLVITDANGLIGRASIVITDGDVLSSEALSVDTQGTAIEATYRSVNSTLTLVGSDTAENYQRVLRTLTYTNPSATTELSRTLELRVNDIGDPDDRFDGRLSNIATITVEVGAAPDLVDLANAVADAGAQFFGAAWSDAAAQQRALLEDGGQFLPFTEITNANRTLNATVAVSNDITLDAVETPVWVFDDGTQSGKRVEGILTPEELAAELRSEIPQSIDPSFVEVPDQTLLIGSPSHISLDGYDPTGGPLTYTVTTDRPDLVDAEILTGNRSARISVEGYGDMVFELFEDRAGRATERFIQLASDDLFNDGLSNNDFFYDDVIFHRVVDDFVIQGGDPTGTGSGGTGVDFDDVFDEDLQHNRTGLLSFAKSREDTNDSQFFITENTNAFSEAALRDLDFHHSVFGVLTEGEDVRAAISETSVIRPANTVPVNDFRGDRPGVPQVADEEIEEFNITMSGVEIFEDTENAVLFLKANSAAAVGDVVEVTVTVTDDLGNSFDQTFSVTLAADAFNGRPFLADINSPISVAEGEVAVIQLEASDVEGDAVEFGARRPLESAGNPSIEIGQEEFEFTVDANSGLVTVTPPDGFTGTLLLEVQVGAIGLGSDPSAADNRVDRQVIEIAVGSDLDGDDSVTDA
ncbi:MAG: peptidylprolyl isomerase [Planctomycetota bacterium]